MSYLLTHLKELYNLGSDSGSSRCEHSRAYVVWATSSIGIEGSVGDPLRGFIRMPREWTRRSSKYQRA